MDRLWDEDPRFREAWRRITVLWGITSIIDAVIRVVVAYTLPIPVVPAMEPVITVATIVALQIPTIVLLRRSGTWHVVFAPRRPARRAGAAAVSARVMDASAVGAGWIGSGCE